VSRIVTKNNTHSHLLPSLLRGLYARVARQMDVDPSYVSRVARGERRSKEISLALEQEMERVLALSHQEAGEERGGSQGGEQSR
jgi:hypothetical protein